MNWKRMSIPILLITALVVVACGAQAERASEAEAPMADFSTEGAQETAGGAFSAADEAVDIEAGEAASPLEQAPQERLIIRTADLSIVVEDTEEALADISQMAEQNEGWVVRSNVFQSGENAKTGDITIRVPSTGFDSALEAIKGLAIEVTSESTSGQDVTEEFVDLEARLRNLEATADRVRSFLDEARDVEDALAVNQELSRLEEQIEVAKGRMQFLEQSARFSTINVHLTPDALSQPLEVGGWQPQGVARAAVQALVDTLQVIASALIWIALFVLPIGLLIVVPLWLVVRFWRQRRRQQPAPTSAE